MALLNRIIAYYYERNRSQVFSIASFAFLTGWVISFPYEGPVFYALIAESGRDLSFINSYNLFFLAAGLLAGIFIHPSRLPIKNLLLALLSFCLLGSLVLPLLPAEMWLFLLPALTFAAGSGMALNGYQVKKHFPQRMWASVAPDTMILSCLVVVGAHILVSTVNFFAGFVLIETILAISIITLSRVENEGWDGGQSTPVLPVNIIRNFWLLFVFIFIIAINAGIMFQTIYPSFAEYKLLGSIYTNLPYIAAIVICSKFYKKNKFNLLYGGLALWGIAFLMFSHMEVSPTSFILIITCMLFSAGIFDLYWWTIMTTSFSYVKNPATMFGAILSVNVIGSWAGGVISSRLAQTVTFNDNISLLGLLVVMVCMVLVTPLNRKLSSFLEHNDFLESPYRNDKEKTEDTLKEKLSFRELEVFELLIAGMKDKEISANLNISLHTVKTHNRKIYNKLAVKNRTELRRQFKNSDKIPPFHP